MTQETVNPSIVSLIEANASLVKQCEAKDKRIRYLEYVLEQRTRATKAEYDPEALARMEQLCYEVFLKHPGRGYTYEEFEDAFEEQNNFRSANTGQRLRDLRQNKKIWSDGDPVRFYLKLKEMKP